MFSSTTVLAKEVTARHKKGMNPSAVSFNYRILLKLKTRPNLWHKSATDFYFYFYTTSNLYIYIRNTPCAFLPVRKSENKPLLPHFLA